MVVDDEPINLRLIGKLLNARGYDRHTLISDPTTVIERVQAERPDVLLLDIMMPQISGLEVLRQLKENESTRFLPVIVLTAVDDESVKSEALELGALEFLPKPFNNTELALRLRNVLKLKKYQDWLHNENRHLENIVAERSRQLMRSRFEVVRRLAKAAEFRDNETGRHVIRVSMYAAEIARGLGLSDDDVELVYQTTPMHDLGKIGIPDNILLKPGKLTDDEFAEMKRHTIIGFEMLMERLPKPDDVRTTLSGTFDDDERNPLITTSSMIALTHHEKLDGSGYPFGLSGTQIPLEGRIVAVADVFDALQAARPYKDPFPLERCLAILRESSGTHFDPAVVDVFFKRLDKIRIIQTEYAEPIR